MQIICKRCGKEKQKYAKGLCMGCYQSIRRPNYSGKVLVSIETYQEMLKYHALKGLNPNEKEKKENGKYKANK